MHSVKKYKVSSGYVPISQILVTLMMEALNYTVTSVLTRATWRNIPEDTILHSHHRENPKSYKFQEQFMTSAPEWESYSGDN
jgi:hypothetical protein